MQTYETAKTAKPRTNGNSAPQTEHPLDARALLAALRAMRDGDFTVQLPGDWVGLPGKIADTFNEIAAANRKMAEELERVGQAVGKQGKTRQRVRLDRRAGAWAGMENSVNNLV